MFAIFQQLRIPFVLTWTSTTSLLPFLREWVLSQIKHSLGLLEEQIQLLGQRDKGEWIRKGEIRMESVKKAFLTPFYAFLSLQYWTELGITYISCWVQWRTVYTYLLHKRQAATRALRSKLERCSRSCRLLCCNSWPDTHGIYVCTWFAIALVRGRSH